MNPPEVALGLEKAHNVGRTLVPDTGQPSGGLHPCFAILTAQPPDKSPCLSAFHVPRM